MFLSANNKDKENAEYIKNSKLVVALECPSQRHIEKLKKKGKTDELKEYEQKINDYNAGIKKVIENLWTFCSDIVFIEKDNIETYTEKLEGGYTTLSLITLQNGSSDNNPPFEYEVAIFVKNKPALEDLKSSGLMFRVPSQKRFVSFIPLPFNCTEIPSIAMGVMTAGFTFNCWLNEVNAKDLKKNEIILEIIQYLLESRILQQTSMKKKFQKYILALLR